MTFTIPVIPVPKARPRVMRGGWTFTPKKTRDAEQLVRFYAGMALKVAKDAAWGENFIDRLSMTILFFGARKNADIDNLAKTVMDSLQGFLFKNDCQVDHLELWRHPGEKGKEHTVVEVKVLC